MIKDCQSYTNKTSNSYFLVGAKKFDSKPSKLILTSICCRAYYGHLNNFMLNIGNNKAFRHPSNYIYRMLKTRK